jgi:hypothetical protein
MVTQRALLWTCLVLPVSCLYWSRLVESLEGNTWLASLVVLMAWICGCVDMNELTGQPEGEHDDHHD